METPRDPAENPALVAKKEEVLRRIDLLRQSAVAKGAQSTLHELEERAGDTQRAQALDRFEEIERSLDLVEHYLADR